MDVQIYILVCSALLCGLSIARPQWELVGVANSDNIQQLFEQLERGEAPILQESDLKTIPDLKNLTAKVNHELTNPGPGDPDLRVWEATQDYERDINGTLSETNKSLIEEAYTPPVVAPSVQIISTIHKETDFPSQQEPTDIANQDEDSKFNEKFDYDTEDDINDELEEDQQTTFDDDLEDTSDDLGEHVDQDIELRMESTSEVTDDEWMDSFSPSNVDDNQYGDDDGDDDGDDNYYGDYDGDDYEGDDNDDEDEYDDDDDDEDEDDDDEDFFIPGNNNTQQQEDDIDNDYVDVDTDKIYNEEDEKEDAHREYDILTDPDNISRSRVAVENELSQLTEAEIDDLTEWAFYELTGQFYEPNFDQTERKQKLLSSLLSAVMRKRLRGDDQDE